MSESGELDRLIRRLERIRRQIGGLGPVEHNPLAALRNDCIEATQSVRECVKHRDSLSKQGLDRTREGIEAAAAVRRELNNLAIIADRLQAEQARDRARIAPEDAQEVAQILRFVKACLDSEKPGFREHANRPNLNPYTPPLLGGNPVADSALGRRTREAPEIQQCLLTISAGDRQMDQSLDAILDGEACSALKAVTYVSMEVLAIIGNHW